MLNEQFFCQKIQGQGSYNFILIHNAGGDHNFFTYQITILKTFGNVYLLDLPGHGNSAVNVHNHIEASAKLIEELILKNGIDNLVLMGLNNGANIAIEIYHSLQLKVAKLILIDPPLCLESSFIAEIKQFIQVLNIEDTYDKFVDELVSNLLENSTEQNKAIAKNAFLKVDKLSLQQMFASLIEWDSSVKQKIPAIKCPVLCVLTDEHHCSFATIKHVAPLFTIGKVVGSKCWATLEVPDQVNAMINKFILIKS